jgi:hypothetical protein
MTIIEHPITLSCGHGVDDYDDTYQAITKDWTHDQHGTQRALRYGLVCAGCLERYRHFNQLFETEEQALDWMTEEDIVERLQKRAKIRRSIPSRKSVVEGKPDRISELLEEAAATIVRLRGY